MKQYDDNFEVLTGEEVLRRYRDGELLLSPVEFDEGEVPVALRHLIPLAKIWGVGDDVVRDHMRHTADPESLRELRRAVLEVDDAFDAWLASDDALALGPTPAYVAFTNLRMVADDAKD